MEIVQVSDKRGIDQFIHFPWKVYKVIPNWVPPLISEVKFILSDKNPFFRHGPQKGHQRTALP